MAQQYAGLERQSLNLQQRQIDLNRQMAQTSMLIGISSAAVGIGKAIGDYHDQKSNLAIQTGTTQYQAGVTEAITNGYDPYVNEIGEDGTVTRRYVGFDGYKTADGRTLGDLKQNVIDTVGKNYWTNGGANRGMQIATNAFENIELGAQRQLAGEVMKNRQEVFNQELTNAIEVFRQTGDATQLNTVIESATWMSADQKTATRLASERQANLANINDTAMSIAKTEGMDAVQVYLTKQNINEDQKAEISLAAQKARAIAVKPEQDRLNGIWETETANATPATAERLKIVLRSKQSEFEACDNQENYYTFMRRLDSASGGTGRSGRSESEIDQANASAMEAAYKKYESGQIGIDEAYAEMYGLERTKYTIEKTNDYYKRMLEYKDPLTAKAYERFDDLCKEYKVDDKIKNDFKEVLTRMFTNNEVNSKDRTTFVEKAIDEQIAKNMNKALKSGASWSNAELKKQNELSYNGKLDPYFSPVGESGRHEMEVSGAGTIKENVIKYGKEKVEDAIKATDMKYIGHEIEKRGENDETGRIFHIVEDSKGNKEKVIVNPDGKLEYAKDLSPFDDKLKTERNIAIARFDTELTDSTKAKINEHIDKTAIMLRGSRAPDTVISALRENLKKELGNKAYTNEGKAYIDMRIKEKFNLYMR
jgi:hypothetical protein